MRWLAAVLAILVVGVLAAPQGALAQASPVVLEADRAIVLISVVTDSGGRTVRGSGSGMIIEPDGLILTASHVVSRAKQIEVTLPTGELLPARVVGSDSLFDAALIKVEARGPLPTATLGSSSVLYPGQTLIALGRSPRRQQGPTSGGFIELDLEARPGVPYLRASTTVWPGDSGGALVNASGEVMGLIVAITRDGSVSLSVAVDGVKTFIPDLRAGTVRHPWIGVVGATITNQLVAELGLAVRSGVLILEVVEGGPAAQAGLRGGRAGGPRDIPRGGDIITSVDGRPLASFGALASYVLSRRIGDSVTLEFIRDGQVFSATVVLGERPGI